MSGIRPTAGVLVAAATVLAVCAPAAVASVTVSSFSLTPSTTQAGANPNVDIDAQFASSPATDTVRSLGLSLPPGLFANPTAAPACAAADLQIDNCARESLVGSGTITATAFTPFGDFTAPAIARVYLVTPQGAEAGRLGLVAITPVGRVISSAPVTVRTTPDVGLDAVFTDLPNQIAGQTISIRRIQLTLFGTVGANAFTRNPTSCGPATTSVGIVAYDGTTAGAESAFTPTGCDALAFSPAVSASAALDRTGDGVAVTSAVTQPAGQAAAGRITLTFPTALAPRLAEFARACSEADANACPATATAGYAAATTPLLPRPLVGRLILRVRPGSPLPRLAIVFPPPLALQLDGTGALGAGGLSATFDGIPDVPLSSLEVRLDGGSQSVFTGRALCTGRPELAGAFAAHSGAEARARAPIAVSGCKPVKPTVTVSLRGLGGRRPRLSVLVRVPAGAPALRSVNVHVPRGLTVRSRGRLRIAVPAPGRRSVTITRGSPALRVSRSLARRVRAGKHPRLRFVVAVRDARGGIVSVHPRARAR